MNCATFGWNWPSGSGEEDENVNKGYDDDENNNNNWQRTNCDQRSLLEPLAQVSLKALNDRIALTHDRTVYTHDTIWLTPAGTCTAFVLSANGSIH